MKDEPDDDLGLCTERARTLGGDVDVGPVVSGDVLPDVLAGALGDGSDSRYHPPVYVSAINWYSVARGWDASSWLSTGPCTQPTTHFSSSTTSAVGDLDGGVESDMWADCVGMRYCAYDHSDSKYLGKGR